MQRVLLLVATVAFSFTAFAQQRQPVKWTYSSKKLNEKMYEIHLTANISDGWHIYSQQQPKDAIAFPTTIRFTKNPLLTIKGKVKEIGQLEKASIESLGIVQHQYSNQVDFVQLVQLKGNVRLNISGILQFEACTDEECLPTAEVPFNINIH